MEYKFYKVSQNEHISEFYNKKYIHLENLVNDLNGYVLKNKGILFWYCINKKQDEIYKFEENSKNHLFVDNITYETVNDDACLLAKASCTYYFKNKPKQIEKVDVRIIDGKIYSRTDIEIIEDDWKSAVADLAIEIVIEKFNTVDSI